MILLKELLCESPDEIYVDLKRYSFKSNEATYTFFVYFDLVDRTFKWVAYDRKNKKVICEDSEVVDEVYNIKKYSGIRSKRRNILSYDDSTYDDESRMKISLYTISRTGTHLELIDIISYLRRMPDDLGSIYGDGRIFEVGGNYYIAFWPDKEKVRKYKNKLDEFFSYINMDKSKCFIEKDVDSDEFESYDEYFGSAASKSSSYDDKKRQIARDLHIKKGMLDKAILNALESRPKNLASLYANLEKQLKMPIAKIKHIFGDMPLDMAVVKQLREIIKK